MATDFVKQKILQGVKELPDAAAFEEAIERLCFLDKVEEASDSPVLVKRYPTPKPSVSS